MVRKTPSACSQLVRRLRDKGWVEQVRNTANNRQVMLRLTPAGEHVYRDHAAFDKQCQALTFRRLEGFTEAELATYLSIQRRINEPMRTTCGAAANTSPESAQRRFVRVCKNTRGFC
ncbi:MAG: MarR family winged helix-turn-helix transcriptional regulator [Ruthenibacterium lactatiformans]